MNWNVSLYFVRKNKDNDIFVLFLFVEMINDILFLRRFLILNWLEDNHPSELIHRIPNLFGSFASCP